MGQTKVGAGRTAANGRVAALDGVRGIAIAVVVIHNAGFILRGSTAFLPKLTSAVTVTGWIGVQLFFVLSGFLISGILLDARGTEHFFRRFYIRRTLRIFPLYYAFLAVAFLVVPFLAIAANWADAARSNQWWYWTYTSNWGSPLGHDVPGLSHFWSLAVEEQFYLVWPLVIFFLSPRRLTFVCVALIAIAPIARILLHVLGWPQLASYEFTAARWDALAFGAILAVLLRNDATQRLLARRMDQFGGAMLALLILLVTLERGFHEDDVVVQVAGQTLVAALSAWLIYRCLAPGDSVSERFRNALSAPPLRFLGKYSYAMYVLHYPIHRVASIYCADVVNGADTNWRVLRLAIYVSAVAALSIGAALLSWRFLEQPFLRMKDVLAPRSDRLMEGMS